MITSYIPTFISWLELRREKPTKLYMKGRINPHCPDNSPGIRLSFLYLDLSFYFKKLFTFRHVQSRLWMIGTSRGLYCIVSYHLVILAQPLQTLNTDSKACIVCPEIRLWYFCHIADNNKINKYNKYNSKSAVHFSGHTFTALNLCLYLLSYSSNSKHLTKWEWRWADGIDNRRYNNPVVCGSHVPEKMPIVVHCKH